MTAQTAMLHVRINKDVKEAASETLAKFGLSLSDAVRILLTRVIEEGGLPAGLTADPQSHQRWLREQIQKALVEIPTGVQLKQDSAQDSA